MKLYYVVDPMCSWCWGFRTVFKELLSELPSAVQIQYVMGGLAPDSDEPMPGETRDYVQSQWRAVAHATGANFNWDFWEKCQPRRSTYPACRAVITAGQQNEDKLPEMIDAIQHAYYQQARNPSDLHTLAELADEIGLDVEKFTKDIHSLKVEQLLQTDFHLRRQLNVRSFPSLRLEHQQQIKEIKIDYQDTQKLLEQIT